MKQAAGIGILILILASSCAAKDPAIAVRTVEVPIPIMRIPAVKPVYIPELPIDSLSENSTAGEVASAYYNSVGILKRHAAILEISLKPFWDEWKKQRSENL
jgi:hypothetical protein